MTATENSPSLYALLDEALAAQRLRPLDVAFARFLAECDPCLPTELAWLAAVLSRQLADGHLCLDLDQLDAQADAQDWPAHWRALARDLHGGLPASPLLAGADGMPADAPLVHDGTRLYLRRYWNHERAVAHGIAQRVAQQLPASPHLAAELARLFPDGAAMDGTDTNPDWPRIACALSARGAFGVITGGPGTGKTTTVVRLLGLLQTLALREQGQALRIGLAAPTGKAAARLNASISAQRARLDVDEAVRASIPSEVTTLHRLLGARPDTRRFRHHSGHPLALDVLVVDEASMIDLEMIATVLEALPPPARLVLLGDKDQLSSVEAGAVLGDLCRRAEAGHYSAATANWLRQAGCGDIDAFTRDDAQPLDQHIAMLRHSHRFADTSGIGELARAVNAGDTEAVQTVLAASHRDVSWTAEYAHLVTLTVEGQRQPAHDSKLVAPDQRHAGEHRNDTASDMPPKPGTLPIDDGSNDAPRGYRHYLELLQRERPDAEAGDDAFAKWASRVLEAHGHFQLLCALRNGPFGTHALNQRIAETLHANGLIDTDRGWYEGRPVMVLRNDYTLGLMNGDVGIALRRPDRDGVMRLHVAFPSNGATPGDNTVRFILPSRLEETDTVYAMTVHKSQGSEFDHAALLLPDQATAVLTRELLYTGITRARRHFSLIAPQASIDLATSQRTQRHSGLAERLQNPRKPADTL